MPFGLVFSLALADVAGLPLPATRTMVATASLIAGRDFAADNDLIGPLALHRKPRRDCSRVWRAKRMRSMRPVTPTDGRSGLRRARLQARSQCASANSASRAGGSAKNSSQLMRQVGRLRLGSYVRALA